MDERALSDWLVTVQYGNVIIENDGFQVIYSRFGLILN